MDEVALRFRGALRGFLWMNPAEQTRRLATLNDRRSSILAKGHRQLANLRSGFLECWSWPGKGADAASAPFRVPARRRHGTYVCPNAHQVIGPMGSIGARRSKLLGPENGWLLVLACSHRLIGLLNKPSCPSFRLCAMRGLGYASSSNIPSSDSPAHLRR